MQPPAGPVAANNPPSDGPCNCCPYGFHIDLDFVKFAENVATGKDHIQNWAADQRTRRRMTSPFEDRRITAGHPPDSSMDERTFSPMDSVLSKSVDELTSDLEELLAADPRPMASPAPPTSGVTVPQLKNLILQQVRQSSEPAKPQSILKNRSDGPRNGVQKHPQFVTTNGTSNGTYSPTNGARSRTDSLPLSLPLRSSAPKNVNEEIQQILSRSSGLPPKSVTSAPTSPVPRTYYTAVAQSMSNLKKRPPAPPPKPSNRPDILAGPVSGIEVGVSGSGQAGPFSYTYDYESRPSQYADPSAKPPAPRRYIDTGRRFRVLSPEPEGASSVPSTLLRTSNLYNRAYHSPGGTTMPYRGRGGTTHYPTGSSLIDLDAFASVRRGRADDSPQRPGLFQRNYPTNYRSASAHALSSRAADGYTSDVPSGGLSSGGSSFGYRYAGTGRHRTMSPPPTSSSVPASSTLLSNGFSSLTRPSTVAYARTEPSMRFDTHTSTAPVAVSRKVEMNGFHAAATPTFTRPATVDGGTQTAAPNYKSISMETEATPVPKSPQKKPTSDAWIGTFDVEKRSVATDTVELQRLRRNKDMVIEFQYCLGHTDMELETPDKEKSGEQLKYTEAQFVELSNAVNRPKPILVDTASSPIPSPPHSPRHTGIGTALRSLVCTSIQTDSSDATLEERAVDVEVHQAVGGVAPKIAFEIATQTEDEWLQSEVKLRLRAEKEKRKSLDVGTETEEEEAGEFIMITCNKCDRSSLSSAAEHYEKITDDGLVPITETLTVPQGSPRGSDKTDSDEGHGSIRDPTEIDPDRDSIDTRDSMDTDMQTVIEVRAEDAENGTSPRQLGPIRADAVRKLLTDPQRQPFQRESYRSYRTDKSKAADDLDYITDRHTTEGDAGERSTPSAGPKKALKEMVVLKKNIAFPSNVPEPVSAKIPRPKFTKYSPIKEHAETAEEEEEAADRLTPLRSEMRSLAAWGSAPRATHGTRTYRYPAATLASTSAEIDDDASSTSSTDSEGTYNLSDREDMGEFEVSTPLKEALDTLNAHLSNPESVTSQAVEWATKYIQHEWLKVSTKRNANAEWVESFIDALEAYSPKLMETVVNMTDQNGNAALHYAVSHENYDVIGVLLDSKVTHADETNKAGYSAVMLGALCDLKNETESAIIQRLFQMGNVNAKAVHHGQTALMLAVSHGRIETTNLLLNCGADVNIQDIDGSTALMCAAEHGQKELVKVLLKRPNVDASLTDCDNQTALSIAVENQHRDIGVLIYAHLNFSRLDQNESTVAV